MTREDTLSTLNDFKHFTKGWDSYDSEPPSLEALTFLEDNVDRLPLPERVLPIEGGAVFYYGTAKVDLEVTDTADDYDAMVTHGWKFELGTREWAIERVNDLVKGYYASLLLLEDEYDD